MKVEVTADGFLGFGEGAVGHGAALFAGDDLAGVLQGMASGAAAFLFQALEPGVPVRHDLLDLLGGEAFVPVGAAEEEKVINLFGGCVHGCFGSSGYRFNPTTNGTLRSGQPFDVG
jgi:hypothetical protein